MVTDRVTSFPFLHPLCSAYRKLPPGALPSVRRQINTPCPLRRDCNVNKHLNERTAEQRGGFDLPSAFVNITMVVGIQINIYLNKHIHVHLRCPCLIPPSVSTSPSKSRGGNLRQGAGMNSEPPNHKTRQNYPPLLNNIDSRICKRRMFFFLSLSPWRANGALVAG